MTIEVGGSSGGLKPPTSLSVGRQYLGTNFYAQLQGNVYAAYPYATLTSGAGQPYTEVLNIAGSGVLQFAGVICSSSNYMDASVRVTLDGVVVAEGEHYINDDFMIMITGVYENQFRDAPLIFNKSLKIELKANGGYTMKLMYRRYLT